MNLGFRRMREEDLALVHEWLQRPHVVRWWRERAAYEDTVERYLPAIEGTDPTDLYLADLDGEPVAFLQTYLIADYPDYAALVGAGEGAAGMDLLIGDESRTGQGLGTELIDRFVKDVVFARTETASCYADPDAKNVGSIRAFEKAGFRVVRELVDPEDGQVHALVRRDR
jgi:RimJ/RimL family protein N-acetyltransferase